MCPTAPNHLSRHQCTRRIVLQSAPAKGCSTGGHFLPLRNQRHIEVGRPLDSISTGSVEYAGTLLHICQLEDLRATSKPCPPFACACAGPLFFFPALPDECVTLSVNSGMRMKMRSKFPRQRTRKHNRKPNQHHKPNPKNKNPSAKPVVPREMQTR